MTRHHYQEKTDEVFASVYRMGVTANDAVRKALHAFMEGDVELARRVKEEDPAIDRMQVEIDHAIITLIAIEHPVAHDLCRLFASSKIVVELERLADHAAHVAKASRKLSRRPTEPVLDLIRRMGNHCVTMLDGSMAAFREQDEGKAQAVAALDDELDALHRRAVTVLLSGCEPENMEDVMRLLFTARYLERIGDHVTNICEWVLYGRNAEAARLNLKSRGTARGEIPGSPPA